FVERGQNRVESLDMADRQNQSILRRQFRQFAGMSGVVGNWFLYQQMFAASKQGTRNFVVRIGWRRNRGRIDHLSKFVKRLRRRNAIFFRNGVRFRKIDIVNGGKLRRGSFSVEPGMIASNMSDANNADSQVLH